MSEKKSEVLASTPGSVGLWGSVLLAVTLVGCNSLQAEDSASMAPELTAIKVYFDGNCPDAVDDFVVEANVGDNIVWQAVKDDGTDDTKQYEIYFDPFVGSDIKSNPQGRTNPKQVHNSIPTGVLYKYTIVGENCSEPPLDPFIRLR